MAEFIVTPIERGKRWSIASDGTAIGNVERFQTGYMVTLFGEPPKKVKRFRMIDALNEALGEDAQIVREKEPGAE